MYSIKKNTKPQIFFAFSTRFTYIQHFDKNRLNLPKIVLNLQTGVLMFSLFDSGRGYLVIFSDDDCEHVFHL